MSKPPIKKICEKLDELHAQSVLVLNTSETTTVCDYMVIATVESQRQMNAITASLLREFKKDRLHSQPESDDSWALVHIGDTIIHIMTPEARLHYNLEELWDKKK